MLEKLRGAWSWIHRAGLAVVLLMALVYPYFGLLTKTEGFQFGAFQRALSAARAAGEPSPWLTAMKVWTLDGGAYFTNVFPDDMAAAVWLRSAPDGNMVEATRQDASYHGEIALVSTYSGLPTILGWPGHESQWRGTYDGLPERMADIQRLYETSNWDEAQAILIKYSIRYVYVGTQERLNYHVNDDKFKTHLEGVFSQGQVVIYEVPAVP